MVERPEDLEQPAAAPSETPIERAAAAALEEQAAVGDTETVSPPSPARRGRGRPRGSRTRHRGRPAPEPAAEPEPEPPTEAELAAMGRMVGATWKVIGGMMRRRRLTDAEQQELAAAAIPVLQKYGGGLTRWAVELNLAFVLYGLWIETEIPKEELPDGRTEGD
jgi:hypothetical protein